METSDLAGAEERQPGKMVPFVICSTTPQRAQSLYCCQKRTPYSCSVVGGHQQRLGKWLERKRKISPDEKDFTRMEFSQLRSHNFWSVFYPEKRIAQK